MTESRPNRHVRANRVDDNAPRTREPIADYDVRTSDGRRAFAAALIASESPLDRTAGRDLLARRLLVSDSETVQALVLDDLTTHPEESGAIIEAFSRYLTRVKVPIASVDTVLGEALASDAVPRDQLAGILDQWSLAQLSTDWQIALARRVVAVLSSPGLPPPLRAALWGWLARCSQGSGPAVWSDEDARPGGPLLHPLFASPHTPEETRNWIVATWMIRRGWPRERVAQVDGRLDPELRARALLHSPEITMLRSDNGRDYISYPLDEPLLACLFRHAQSRDERAAQTALDLLRTALGTCSRDGIAPERVYRRFLDPLLSRDSDPRIRERFLKYALAKYLLTPSAMHKVGIRVEHPGPDAPFDAILAALCCGAEPRREDFGHLATALREVIDRAKEPHYVNHEDRWRTDSLREAIQRAVSHRVQALGLASGSSLASAQIRYVGTDHLRQVAAELQYLTLLYEDDRDAWKRVLLDPAAPRTVRLTGLQLLKRAAAPESLGPLYATLLHDEALGGAVAEEMVRGESPDVLVATIEANPSPHHAKFYSLWPQLPGDAILRLLAHPGVQQVPELRATLNDVVLGRVFGYAFRGRNSPGYRPAWQRASADREIHDRQLPIPVFAPFIRSVNATRNPLTVMEKCWTSASPEDRETLRAVFVSSAIQFSVARYLTTSALRNLPADLLIALFRANPNARFEAPQRVRAILTEVFLHGDPEVALESLNCTRAFRIGSLSEEPVRERLIRFGRLATSPERIRFCACLWREHRGVAEWTVLLREAYQDANVADAVLEAVSDFPAIARIWSEASPAERTSVLRRRLLARCGSDDDARKDIQRLTPDQKRALHDLAAAEETPGARLIRTTCGTRAVDVEAELRNEDVTALIAEAGEFGVPAPRRVAILKEIRRRRAPCPEPAYGILKLLAMPDTPADVRELINDLGQDRFLGTTTSLNVLLDDHAYPPRRDHAAKAFRMASAAYANANHARQRDLTFAIATVVSGYPANAAATAGLRRLLVEASILPRPPSEEIDWLSPLTDTEVRRARRWLELRGSGRMAEFWTSLTAREGESEDDVRLLLGSFRVWGVLEKIPGDREMVGPLLALPLPADERRDVLMALAGTPALNSAASNHALMRLAWGEEDSAFRAEARAILEDVLKTRSETYNPTACALLAESPAVPSKVRYRAILRYDRQQPLNILPFLLSGELTDVQRERLLKHVIQNRCRLPARREDREALLDAVRDRGRTIGVRTALIQSLDLLDAPTEPDPQPVHWDAGEAIEGEAIDPRQDAAQAALWELLGDNHLPSPVRATALTALLRSYHVPENSRFQELFGRENARQQVQWLLRQLRAVNRLPDHAWRNRIVTHQYRNEIGAIEEIASRLPQVPVGLALYVADITSDRPELGAAIAHAFALRRGAVATTTAIGTWLEFLTLVTSGQVPDPVLGLFQLPTDREADDPTLLADTWLRWRKVRGGADLGNVPQMMSDRQRSFAERARDLETPMYQQTARILATSEEGAPEEVDRITEALRVVTPHTPAPQVLAGHYRTCHAKGLALLGKATVAWAEGNWSSFRYDPSQNRTLAALPEDVVAAWRAPMGFAVPQARASGAFVEAARAISSVGRELLVSRLSGTGVAEEADLRRLAERPSCDPTETSRVIRHLEEQADALGRDIATQATREAAYDCREKIRSLRFLATLARFAFLDPDALAVNELRAVGEQTAVLADGGIERRVSVFRAFDRLKGQSRDAPSAEQLQPGLQRLAGILDHLPEFPERADLIVEARDDFPTLIEIGARPYGSGSCQNYQSTHGYNRALLAYVCDGDKQALVAREARPVPPGSPPDLRARAILRLGRTREGAPALLLEPIYASGGRGDQLRQEIERLARQKAEALRAVLLRSQATGSSVTIALAPSRNGFQYEDSGGGLRSDAEGYTLNLPMLADFR